MAKRKNFISIDFNQFNEYAERLEALNVSLKDTFTKVMEEQGKKVAQDTEDALANEHLPAKGKFSRNDRTKEAVIREPKVEWSGTIAEMPLGFDHTKPNAGSWLITGTPKMNPDKALEKIYRKNAYEKNMIKAIAEELEKEVQKHMKG